eukprot:s1007_g24.t1
MAELGRKVKVELEMAEKENKDKNKDIAAAVDKESDEGNQAQPASHNPIPDITGDANIIAFAQKVLQEVDEGNFDWDLEQVCKKVGEHSKIHAYSTYLHTEEDLQEEWEWCAPGNDFHEDLIDFVDFVTKSGGKRLESQIGPGPGVPVDAMTKTGAHNVEPAGVSVTENDPNPNAEKDKADAADDETNAEIKDPGPNSENHSETVEPLAEEINDAETKTMDPNLPNAEKNDSDRDGETEVVTTETNDVENKDPNTNAEKKNGDGDGETVEVVPDKTLKLANKDPAANADKNNVKPETIAEPVTHDKTKGPNTSCNTADAEATDEDAEESESEEMLEDKDSEVTETNLVTKPKTDHDTKDKEKYKKTTAASAKSKAAAAKNVAKAKAKGKAKASASAKGAKAATKTKSAAAKTKSAKADAGKSRGKKPKVLPEEDFGVLGDLGTTVDAPVNRHVTYQYNEFG